MKFCPECGKEWNGSKFCAECGKDLRNYISGGSESEQAPVVKDEMAFTADFDFLSELDNLANVGEQASKSMPKEDEIDVEQLSDEADRYYNEENYEKAVELWKKCAERGYAYAQYSLGWCYEHGEGIGENIDMAIKWYEQALENGYNGDETFKESFDALKSRKQAEMWMKAKQYDDGGNHKQAVAIWRKSAEQGFALSQLALAVCYQYGTGVTKSLEDAIKWYKLAAAQGNESAIKELKKLNVSW